MWPVQVGTKLVCFCLYFKRFCFAPASFELSLIWVKCQPSTNWKKSQRSNLKDDLHCCSLCLGRCVCVCFTDLLVDWLSRSLSKRERASFDLSFSCLLVYQFQLALSLLLKCLGCSDLHSPFCIFIVVAITAVTMI